MGNLGFLVLIDVVDPAMYQRKTVVPGVLGSNPLSDIKMIVGRNSHNVSKDVRNLIALHEEVAAIYIRDSVKVWVARQKPVLVPACSLQVIEGSIPSSKLPYIL